MDSGFREFHQTPRGRGFIILEFYTLFKCFIMFWLDCGLERPFDRSQNLGSNCLNLWNPNLQSVTAHGLFGWLIV